MIIDCISDLHGAQPELEGGDLLIVAGDLTARDKPQQFSEFKDWLCKQPYKKSIILAGNHDGLIEKGVCMGSKDNWESEATSYLQDSSTTFQGLKIYGSPWTLRFAGMNPDCMAFTKKAHYELKEYWDKIPDDVDILITHSPPYGMLDQCSDYRRVGCKHLADRVMNLKNLKLHVFGHIHEAYGQCHKAYETPGDARNVVKKDYTGSIPIGHLSVNAAIMNEYYKPVNKPIRVIL